MDPVLKAGLPNLFVLASLQTTATHTVTECRERKKHTKNIYGKSTDKKSKLPQGKRPNISGLSVKKKKLPQQSKDIGKNGQSSGRRSGGIERHVCVHSLTSHFNQSEFVINGFSH